MMIDSDTFIAHVAAHAGIPAERAVGPIRQVVCGLGACLSGADRGFVAEELPPVLAEVLARGREGEGRTRGIAGIRIPGMSITRTRELVASVCRVLAERLSTSALDRLRGAVPHEVAKFLGEPAAEQVDPLHAPSHNPSLASGRPGSTRPLSEARPGRVQAGSVADPNPHAATKLSSSSGMTQERRHDTLAEGRPGHDLPLSGPRKS